MESADTTALSTVNSSGHVESTRGGKGVHYAATDEAVAPAEDKIDLNAPTGENSTQNLEYVSDSELNQSI